MDNSFIKLGGTGKKTQSFRIKNDIPIKSDTPHFIMLDFEQNNILTSNIPRLKENVNRQIKNNKN